MLGILDMLGLPAAAADRLREAHAELGTDVDLISRQARLVDEILAGQEHQAESQEQGAQDPVQQQADKAVSEFAQPTSLPCQPGL